MSQHIKQIDSPIPTPVGTFDNGLRSVMGPVQDIGEKLPSLNILTSVSLPPDPQISSVSKLTLMGLIFLGLTPPAYVSFHKTE